MFLTASSNHRLGNLIDEVDQQWHNLVENFFKPNNLGDLKNKLKNNSGYPKIDVFTDNERYCVQASVPGVKPDDLSVEVFSDNKVKYVRITGQMAQEYKEESALFSTKELRRGSFSRTLALPDNIEGDPEAKIRDGILTLTWAIPKVLAKAEEVKKIPLKIE